MKKGVQFFLVVLLIVFLILIRALVAPIFYDPLNTYFKNDYLYVTPPKIELVLYFLHLFFRYFLNTVLSIAIIYVVFNNRKLVQFSLKFYVIAFFVLSSLLFVLLKFHVAEGYMLLFYVRRFLIHPLFVFILMPAFYYQNLQFKN